MCAGNKVAFANSRAREDVYKAEFSAALDELVGKIRFRGSGYRKWIARQIVHKLVEEPIDRDEVDALLNTQSDRKW